MERQTELIAELLGDVTGNQALDHTPDKARPLIGRQRAVLEPPCHQRSRSAVPNALGVCLKEANALLDGCRIIKQELVCKPVQLHLVKRAQIPNQSGYCQYARIMDRTIFGSNLDLNF